MTECDHMLTALEEKILKWQSALDAGKRIMLQIERRLT